MEAGVLTPAWIWVAFLLAVAAALVTFCLASGLPAEAFLALWSPSLRWSLSKAGVFVVSGAAFAVAFAALWLIFAIVAGTWRGLGFVAALIFPMLVLPVQQDQVLGLRTMLVLLVVAALVSTVFQSALAVLALAIASLGLGAAICARLAFLELENNHDGLGVSSRSSAIGGGQTEWRISPALLFSLLALALAGGTVALGAAALRPAPPAATAVRIGSSGGAKDESKGAAGETFSESVGGELKLKTVPNSPTEK
jgi:hypothetical protein